MADKTALILAGGKGERLRPLTNECPKTMVELDGKPLIEFQLRWLQSFDYRNVVVACGYKHDLIEQYLGDGSDRGMNIRYSVEREPLGRGGAMKAALAGLHPDEFPVLAINGDIVSTIDLAKFRQFHEDRNALVSIVAVPFRSQYGIIELDSQNFVESFTEKPELPHLVNAGIYLLNEGIVKHLPDKGDHESSTFPALAAAKQLRAFRSTEFWRAVDTLKDLQELKDSLRDRVVSLQFS